MIRARNFALSIVMLVLLACTLPLTLAAYDWDWGGALGNSTSFDSIDEEELSQENKVTLWTDGEQELDISSLSLTAQGYYLFTDERPYLFDVEILRLKGRFPTLLGTSSVVEGSVGRFHFADPTGYILSHTADGASVNLLFPRLRIKLDGGYTGLLLNPSSDIRISDIDFTEKFDEDEEFFGPKRLFTQGQLTFTDLGALRRWVFFGLAQFDLREEDPTTETVDTQYWGTLMSFAFFRNFYHDAFLTVGTSQSSTVEESEAISILTGFTSQYLREDWLASRFSLTGLAATPDAPVDDIDLGFDVPYGVSQFRPMNTPSIGAVVDPTLDSLLYANFEYALRPFLHSGSGMMSRIEPSFGVSSYFRVYKWNADWMVLEESADSWFLGMEYDAGLTWRILSDLSTRFSGGMFVPGAAWSKNADPEYMFEFELSASF